MHNDRFVQNRLPKKKGEATVTFFKVAESSASLNLVGNEKYTFS